MTLRDDNYPKTTGAVVPILNTYHKVEPATETFKTKEDVDFIKKGKVKGEFKKKSS